VGIVEMRRHYSNYFKGISHFKEFRMRLVTSMNYEEILNILEEVSVFYGQEEMMVLD
jgi:tRNA-dihydrouridine synthase B